MSLFSDQEQEQIKQTIALAEKATSGEIRVCIEKHCKTEPMKRAIESFEKLEMHTTKLRNGVLIYLATEDKKFAIIGDSGINKLVKPDFWDTTKEVMLDRFKHHDMVGGLCFGIEEAGKQLKKFFPYQHNDENELPDDVVML